MWCASERAQVYARDDRLQEDAPLVYLPRGGADAVRQDARDGHLICPLPECNERRLIVRAGTRRDHFAHHHAPTQAHAPESVMHLQGKAMIASWLRGLFGGRLKVGLEVPIGDRARVADVLAVSPTSGERMAFEVQYAAITVEEWEARHADYQSRGIVDVWLWGHLPPHCRRPHGDALEGERAITPAMLACRTASGRPLLWINPEEQMLAIGLTRLDIDLEDIDQLARGDATGLSWAFHEFTAAIVSASVIDDWRLSGAGPTGPLHGQADDLHNAKAGRDAKREAAQALRDAAQAELKRHAEELAARAAWREQRPDELRRLREEHARRDQERWRRDAPALLAQVGGELPEVIARPLRADRSVFMAGEHWRAIVYACHIYNLKPGESFTYRDVCRTLFGALASIGRPVREGRRVYPAITELLFRLRRESWLDFDPVPGSWHIPGRITLGKSLAQSVAATGTLTQAAGCLGP
jgi:competence protein CoiA-like protein